jgi:predicted dehydrogenase
MRGNVISRRRFVSASAASVSGLMAMSLPGFSKPVVDDVISLGIIGTGSRGTGLLSILKSVSGVKVVACCDIIAQNLSAGMKLADKSAIAYTDYRKLLDDKKIQAVIIATPLYLHYPMAVDALSAGKHIFLEKSMTYNIDQALDLVKKVRQSRLVFQVGYQYRNFALYHKVKSVIEENWLGKISYFECQYNRNSNWRFPVKDPAMERAINWRMYREYCGGPLSELCAHQIDAVQFFLGQHPLKVTGIGGIDYWKDGRETYDNIHTIYEYPDGIKNKVSCVLSNAFNGYRIMIFGDKGSLEIQRDKAYVYAETSNHEKGIVDGVSGATIAAITQGKPVEVVYADEGKEIPEPTVNALSEFLECIRTGRKPVSNVETGKDSSIAVHLGNLAADTQTLQEWRESYNI